MSESKRNQSVHVRYSKTLGRYNMLSDEKDWQVTLFTHLGNVSQRWPEDQEPDIEDLLPSEVLSIISERLEYYMYSSNRDESRKRIAEIREHATELDKAWLADRIKASQRKLESYELRLEQINEAEAS